MRDSKTRPTGSFFNSKWRELNAFTYLDPALEAHAASNPPGGADVSHPRQSLAGYSLVIKDNIEVAGMPCTCGTPGLRTYVPKLDAPAVARLRSADAALRTKLRR